ncbi:MAG: CarD family transcriptional regulator, partial [Mycobacteriales bacterium]
MNLSPLLDLAARDPALRAAAQRAGAPHHGLVAPAGFVPVALAVLARQHPVLAVTATGRQAEDLAAALADLLATDSVALYPSWETLPHERLSPRADTVGRRLAVLRRLAHPDDRGPLAAVVAPVRSLLQPQVARLGDVEPVRLAAGDSADLTATVERLVALGYQRVDLVERRGELAVRGGLLDCFPPTEEHPVRVEFFGDEVDEIRHFAVADQRSLDTAPRGLEAPPCRELLLTDRVRERARRLAVEHPQLADLADRIAAGDAVEGMEALAPVLADALGLLVDELPDGTHVLLVDPERVRSRAADLVRTSREFLEASWSTAATGGAAPVDLEPAAYRTLADVAEHASLAGIPWWTLAPFGDGAVVGAAPVPEYRGDFAKVTEDLARWVHGGYQVALVAQGPGFAERLAEVLSAGADGPEVAARFAEDLPDPLPTSVVTCTTGQLGAGFVADPLRLVVLTETDLAGHRGVSSTRDMRRMPVRRRGGIDPLQLRSGDLVVHEQHGVGRYLEMVRRSVNGGEREYLILEYAKGDRLYVPTDALDLVTRYVGGEGPALSRLGGSDWARTKGRARKAVREIAAELIRLYSARMASPGYAFSPDTPWQRELEDAFPYHETPDQLAAVNEVKADMERRVPMDRVICGDVGYGKTEIAVRAAFKAAQDGKQVAVLVPTTLLVAQHLTTFTERFSAFPVT